MSTRLEPSGIATLTIDNSARLNIVNRRVLRALIDAAEALTALPELRVVVLRGAGDRAFIGGADIAEMASLDTATARGFITEVHRACDVFRCMPVPVIARIQGYALGAGLEIAAACDLRVASDDARFGMPEVRVGIPSVVEAALLPGLIGWGRTRRLLLTGEMIDAAQALAWGLVEEVTRPDALDPAVAKLADAILAAGPRAVRLQKELIRQWEDLPVAEAVARGIDCFVRSWETDEPAGMMGSFLERRR
ncbi:MAG TPA: enoyl-CoA hydratase [Acetobacteraceae bacterium]|nr:enoyl-CoA hydratase [Acetobacteraceae bacterium]